MLFTSPEFLLGFLPATLIGFYAISRFASEWSALTWLMVASLFFYAWWDPSYLPLLLASVTANFLFGGRIAESTGRIRNGWLLAGIAANVGAISYYKYGWFLAEIATQTFGGEFKLEKHVIPLGISFFTFQQIAYLCDIHARQFKRPSYRDYLLLVSFFPHLIAGPIVHPRLLLPQLAAGARGVCTYRRLSVGSAIFLIGLFKKIALADSVAVYADPVFAAAAAGQDVSLLAAWGGALAYTCQLYFDFSGYSDMAIGLAFLFGIRLPMNFYSPYKSGSIIEFWRRWHITLSMFLRNYLYIPLGGNRGGPNRRYVNLMITMLLGGIWHGAGWTFLIWGAMHGAYLVINHLWRGARVALGYNRPSRTAWLAGAALTFVAVVVSWVVFRADTLSAATLLLSAMFGFGSAPMPQSAAEWAGALVAPAALWDGYKQVAMLAALLGICWFLPNTYQLMWRFRPVLTHPFLLERVNSFNVSPALMRWGVAYAILIWGIAFSLPANNAFLYFNF